MNPKRSEVTYSGHAATTEVNRGFTCLLMPLAVHLG